MEVDPGSALPAIDTTLKACCKSVCRLIQVLKEGGDPDPFIYHAYKTLLERYSGPLVCRNPEAVIFIQAERVALQPKLRPDPAPLEFRSMFDVRVADTEQELMQWDRVRTLINRVVRRRLWTVAALYYDDLTEDSPESHSAKLERIGRVLNRPLGTAHDLVTQVRRDLERSRELARLKQQHKDVRQ
jgi:hypothetical protein